MDLASLTALRSPAGAALLAGIGDYDSGLALALGARLRERHPGNAGLVAAAMTQARLRTRALGKFGPDASRMWFTPAGLEQASRSEVAQRRAARFAALGLASTGGVTGRRADGPASDRVADLGCGLGTDAFALARAGLRVLAIERDPVTAALARANAEDLGLADRVDVRVGDVTDAEVLGAVTRTCAAVFIDPARRDAHGRRLDPQGWSPPWSWVRELACRVPALAAKVAPGIAHDAIPDNAETQWVSVGGDVVEAVVWWGALAGVEGGATGSGCAGGTGAGGGRRRATLLPGPHELTSARLATARVAGPGRWLYEPDAAVIRAGLVGHVATAVDGWLIDPTIAYVCADRHVPTQFATAYEVTDVMAFSLKKLRALLRERGVGTVVVKKRGSAIEPEQLRRQLRPAGPNAAVVILTRVAGAPTVLLARRPT